MKYGVWVVGAILCGWLAAGCRSDVAGGSGSEAGETISVVLVDSGGKAVTHGSVRIYRESESDPFSVVPIDSVTGKSKIEFLLKYSEHPYSLEFFGGDSNGGRTLTRQTHTVSSPLTLDTVEVSPLGKVKGSVSSVSGTPRLVRLFGTPYESPVDNGSYKVEGVAPGSYPVLVQLDLGSITEWAFIREIDVPPTAALTQNLQARSGELLLEDFDDGDSRGALAPILGGGNWEMWGDDSLGGNSDWSPDLPPEEYFQQALESDQAFQGLSFHGRYVLGTESLEYYEPFVAVGLPLGPAYDLASMDTLAFYGKGDGLVWAEFFSVRNDSVFEVKVPFQMTADWREYRVAAESFRVYYQGIPVNGLVWDDMSRTIEKLVFFPASGSEFWMDNIRMVGISFHDLIYRKVP